MKMLVHVNVAPATMTTPQHFYYLPIHPRNTTEWSEKKYFPRAKCSHF